MTFTFKLSKRLSLTWAAAGVALGLFACETGQEPTPPPSLEPQVTQLMVRPEQAMIDPGQSMQFRVYGRTAQGDSVAVEVNWSATAGTITSSGFYTADSSDVDAVVTAALNGGELTQTAAVAKRRVVEVVVTPATSMLQVSATQQFSARGVRNTGDTVPATVTYTATGGSITASGLYTAGSAPGDYRVVATERRTGLAGTAAVTIVDAPPAPVASVSVAPGTATIEVNATVQLSATARDAAGNELGGRAVTWTSSNEAVATISGSGLVRGVSAGSATMTATSEGKSGAAQIAVTAPPPPPPPPPPSSCQTSSPAWLNTALGAQSGSFTVEFDATPNGASIDGVTGVSQGTSADYTDLAAIVRFNVAGTIDARNGGAYGAATAIPYAAGTKYHFRLVVDVPTHSYAAYVAAPSGPEVTIGTGLAFRAEQSAAGSLANWAIRADSGTHTVCDFQVTASAPPVAVASVAVTPGSASIDTGKTVQLAATLRDAAGNTLTGRTVSWSTSAAAVATVSGSGLVMGKGAGSATITATSEGRSGTATVIVSAPPAPPPPPPPPSGSVVFVGAGDIGNCSTSTDEATAKLLDGIAGTVYTTGDNVYSNGTASEFQSCYEPNWGRHKARTRPSPGNHDYNTSGATGYYSYYGATAGPAGPGYYSFDLGDWHIISLNSNVSMSVGSAQDQWLRADLAANPKKCTLAYWHHPRFSSGDHGNDSQSAGSWQTLYDAGADVILVGHDHNYERFAPQTPGAVRDDARGIRQFVIGTGGTSLRGMATTVANSEVRNSDTHGVLKLTLSADSYAWEFVPVAGKTFRDSGSGTCH